MPVGQKAAEPAAGSPCCYCPLWLPACWCRPASCRAQTQIMRPPCRCAMAPGRCRRARNRPRRTTGSGLGVQRITNRPAPLRPRARRRHRQSRCRFSKVPQRQTPFRRHRNPPLSSGHSIAPIPPGRPPPSSAPHRAPLSVRHRAPSLATGLRSVGHPLHCS